MSSIEVCAPTFAVPQYQIAEHPVAVGSSRSDWIDIARGVAILLVMLGHTTFCEQYKYLFQPFRMPLFYITAGYLFNYKRHREALFQYLGQRVRRLALPYFATAFFFYFVVMLVNALTLHHQPLNPLKQLLAIFYGNGFSRTADDYILSFDIPLWFLACMTSASVIFIGLLHLFRNERNRIGLLVSSLTISLAGFLVGRRCCLPMSFDVAMVAQAFLVIGFLLRENAATFADWRVFVMLIGGYLCYCLSSSTLDMNHREYSDLGLLLVAGLAGTYIIYFLSRQLVNRAPDDALAQYVVPILKFMGTNTMVIMTFHWGAFHVMDLIRHFFPYSPVSRTGSPWMMFFMMILTSLVAIETVRRFKTLRAIYYK